MTTVDHVAPLSVGELLRGWRERRRLSQMDLALDAEISTRHLSFVETGRSAPSRDMVLRLADQLEVPLRERNQLLLAGGYAPVYSQASLDSAVMSEVRAAVRQVLTGHEPYPAAAVDRHWNLVEANSGIALMTADVDGELLEAPPNAMRLALHPGGLAPRIANLGEWRAHLLSRLRRQVALTADPVLSELLDEVRAYRVTTTSPTSRSPRPARSSSHCACATATASWPSSAPSPPSAHRSTSPSPSWRSSRSSPPTRRRRQRCAAERRDAPDAISASVV